LLSHKSARRAALGVLLTGLGLAPAHLPAQGTAQGDALARAGRLVRDANQLAARGDTAAALARLTEATKLAPGLAEAHYRRGMLLARQADNDLADMFKRRAAASALERAIRIDRGNPAYFLELGRLRLKQGAMRLDAQRLFNRALTTAQERGDPAVIAEVEAELGDIDYRRYQAVGHRRLLTGDAWQFDPNEAIDNPHYAKDFLAQRSHEIEDAGELNLREAEAHYRAGVAAWPAHDLSNAGVRESCTTSSATRSSTSRRASSRAPPPTTPGRTSSWVLAYGGSTEAQKPPGPFSGASTCCRRPSGRA
jgi:tetratricopeptide (TPR) repeat protein